jgi:hypothetical protein
MPSCQFALLRCAVGLRKVKHVVSNRKWNWKKYTIMSNGIAVMKFVWMVNSVVDCAICLFLALQSSTSFMGLSQHHNFVFFFFLLRSRQSLVALFSFSLPSRTALARCRTHSQQICRSDQPLNTAVGLPGADREEFEVYLLRDMEACLVLRLCCNFVSCCFVGWGEIESTWYLGH